MPASGARDIPFDCFLMIFIPFVILSALLVFPSLPLPLSFIPEFLPICQEGSGKKKGLGYVTILLLLQQESGNYAGITPGILQGFWSRITPRFRIFFHLPIKAIQFFFKWNCRRKEKLFTLQGQTQLLIPAREKHGFSLSFLRECQNISLQTR